MLNNLKIIKLLSSDADLKLSDLVLNPIVLKTIKL